MLLELGEEAVYQPRAQTGGNIGATEVGGPAGSTLFFALHIYDQAFQQGDIGYSSALAWLLVIVVVALTLLIMRSSGKWVHYGA